MNLKDKKLPLIAGGAAVIVILLLLVFMPSKKAEDGPEVISKRVKIEVPADGAASMDSTTDAAGSVDSPVVQTAAPQVQAPVPAPQTAPVAKPAPVQPKAEPKIMAKPVPAPVAPKRIEEPVKAAKATVEKKKEEAPKAKAVTAEKKKTAERTKKVAAVSKRILTDKLWVLNIASFPSISEAQTLALKLKKGGHKAYVIKFTKDSVEWHRVRVGFFASREEAVKNGKSIKTRFGLDEPWVTRPDSAELRAHL